MNASTILFCIVAVVVAQLAVSAPIEPIREKRHYAAAPTYYYPSYYYPSYAPAGPAPSSFVAGDNVLLRVESFLFSFNGFRCKFSPLKQLV
jgi:hypothetical protein